MFKAFMFRSETGVWVVKAHCCCKISNWALGLLPSTQRPLLALFPFLTVGPAQPSDTNRRSRAVLQIQPSSHNRAKTKQPGNVLVATDPCMCLADPRPEDPPQLPMPGNCMDTALWLLALSAGFLGSHLETGAPRRQLACIKSPTALLRKQKSFRTCLPGDGYPPRWSDRLTC